MATAPTRVAWTAEDLLAAVKQLPAAELREFRRRFAAWSGRDKVSYSADDEVGLLAAIAENSVLPGPEQRRFNRLRRKRQAGTLTDREEEQLQELWRQVEQMNAARLEALEELSRRRGTDVRTLMRQLGLPEGRNVF